MKSAQRVVEIELNSAPPNLRVTVPDAGNSPETGLRVAASSLEWRPMVEHGTARRSSDHSSKLNSHQDHMHEVQMHEDQVHARQCLNASCELAPKDHSRAFMHGESAEEAQTPQSEPDPAVRSQIVGHLYETAYHRVYGFVRRSVGEEAAGEISHEVFIRLLKVRNLERMSISVAYLLRIAENLLKRRFERAQRYRVILERSGMVVSESTEDRECSQGWCPGVRSQTGVACDAGRLESVLRHLTSEEQTAIRLIVCEGLDYQAAARSLGVPVSTINNWKHRGLAKLRILIEQQPSHRGKFAVAS